MVLNFSNIVNVTSLNPCNLDYKLILNNFAYTLNSSNFNTQFEKFKLEYNVNKLEDLELFALCSSELLVNDGFYSEKHSKMMVDALEEALSSILCSFPIKSEVGNFSFTPQVRNAYYQLRKLF